MNQVMKIFAGILIFVACQGMAQTPAPNADPTVLGLVGGAAEPAKGDDGAVTSGRYEKRKSKKRRPAQEEAPKPTPAPEVSQPMPSDAQGPQVAPLPSLGSETNSYATRPVPQPAAPSAQNGGEQSFGNRMQDLILGGDPEHIEKYRSFLDVEDIRKNIFEYATGISYFYNASSSPYYSRNYINSSPGAFLGIDIWLTPFLGIDADYRFSILNEIKDSPVNEEFANSSHSWFGLGFKFRRFFGMAQNASSLVIGLKYVEYMLSVQPNTRYRMKQNTRGPELSFKVTAPSTKNFSWSVGIVAQPFLQHEEAVAGADYKAGSTNQTAGFGASLGGEYRFSRQTRAFFNFTTMIYKSQFSGQATGLDPVTGARPTNVPVNNTFLLLDLGLRLGR